MAVACSSNSHALWKDISRDPSSGVFLVRETLHLALSPYYLANVKQSVRSVVDARLIRYNAELGGILAGYERIAITDSTAPTLFNLSDVHVDVKGDFYIFKPEVGKELVGVVNKKNYGHVGCLVHGLFNVSLPLPPSTHPDQWIGKSAKLLDKVRFTITRVDLLSQVPFIQGNIVELIPHLQEGSFGTRVRASSDSGVSVASEGSTEITPETNTERKKASKLSLSQRKNEANMLTSKVKDELNEDDMNVDVCQPTKRKRKTTEGSDIHETPRNKRVRLTSTDDSLVQVNHLVSNLFSVVSQKQADESLSSLQNEKSKKNESSELTATCATLSSPKKKKNKHPEAENEMTAPVSEEFNVALSSAKKGKERTKASKTSQEDMSRESDKKLSSPNKKTSSSSSPKKSTDKNIPTEYHTEENVSVKKSKKKKKSEKDAEEIVSHDLKAQQETTSPKKSKRNKQSEKANSVSEDELTRIRLDKNSSNLQSPIKSKQSKSSEEQSDIEISSSVFKSPESVNTPTLEAMSAKKSKEKRKSEKLVESDGSSKSTSVKIDLKNEESSGIFLTPKTIKKMEKLNKETPRSLKIKEEPSSLRKSLESKNQKSSQKVLRKVVSDDDSDDDPETIIKKLVSKVAEESQDDSENDSDDRESVIKELLSSSFTSKTPKSTHKSKKKQSSSPDRNAISVPTKFTKADSSEKKKKAVKEEKEEEKSAEKSFKASTPRPRIGSPTVAVKLFSHKKNEKGDSSASKTKIKDGSVKKKKIDKAADSDEEFDQEKAIQKILQQAQPKEKSAKKSKVAKSLLN